MLKSSLKTFLKWMSNMVWFLSPLSEIIKYYTPCDVPFYCVVKNWVQLWIGSNCEPNKVLLQSIGMWHYSISASKFRLGLFTYYIIKENDPHCWLHWIILNIVKLCQDKEICFSIFWFQLSPPFQQPSFWLFWFDMWFFVYFHIKTNGK